MIVPGMWSALLWGATLAVAVSCAALSVAAVARLRSRWARALVLPAGMLPPFVVIAVGVVVAGLVHDGGGEPCRLPYFVALLSAYVVCGGIVIGSSIEGLEFRLGAAYADMRREKAAGQTIDYRATYAEEFKKEAEEE